MKSNRPRAKMDNPEIEKGTTDNSETKKGITLIISVLFITGILFLISSTVMYSIVIPTKDSQIEEMEIKVRNFMTNYQIYQSTDIMAYLARTNYNIVLCLPPHDSVQRVREIAVNDLYSFKISEYRVFHPDLTESQEKNFRKMPMNKLEQIVLNVGLEHMKKANQKIHELEKLIKKKQKIVYWATIIQIIGLLLNQIGIILQLKFQNN